MADDVAASTPKLNLIPHPDLAEWLEQKQLSIVLTTYQAGKLMFLGLASDGRLSMFERTVPRCLGLWTDGQTLWVTSQHFLWRFQNVLAPGTRAGDFDRWFVPQAGYVTGDLDVHDIVVEENGRLVFTNTRFSCLATTSDRFSFVPLWHPSFVSELLPEDRCHLNGVACDGGSVAFATVSATSNVPEGWREHRQRGGQLIDVRNDTVVVDGLSMPHSPRTREDSLWYLESGRGQLCRVDRQTGSRDDVAFCPGYARGLAFHGDRAVVGLSRLRQGAVWEGLEIERRLTSPASSVCGLLEIHLPSGNSRLLLEIRGIVEELYDVALLPGVVRPGAVGFRNDEIDRTISVAPMAPL